EVVVLEAAPESERGGNTAFTAGAMRVVYESIDDIVALVPDLAETERRTTDFGSYPGAKFFEDMGRVTAYRPDPDLVRGLGTESHDALVWMRRHGVRFAPSYGRQAFNVDGRFRFWGGLVVEVVGGGLGLVEAEHAAAQRSGIDVLYGCRVTALHHD